MTRFGGSTCPPIVLFCDTHSYPVICAAGSRSRRRNRDLPPPAPPGPMAVAGRAKGKASSAVAATAAPSAKRTSAAAKDVTASMWRSLKPLTPQGLGPTHDGPLHGSKAAAAKAVRMGSGRAVAGEAAAEAAPAHNATKRHKGAAPTSTDAELCGAGEAVASGHERANQATQQQQQYGGVVREEGPAEVYEGPTGEQCNYETHGTWA